MLLPHWDSWYIGFCSIIIAAAAQVQLECVYCAGTSKLLLFILFLVLQKYLGVIFPCFEACIFIRVLAGYFKIV